MDYAFYLLWVCGGGGGCNVNINPFILNATNSVCVCVKLYAQQEIFIRCKVCLFLHGLPRCENVAT